MTKTLLGGNVDPGATDNGVTLYLAPMAGNRGFSGTTTEARAQISSAAGTYSLLQFYIDANAGAAVSLIFRVNGANGNQSISVGSGATGWFQDASDSDTLTAGEMACVEASFGGANVNPGQWNVTFDAGGSTLVTYPGMGALSISSNTVSNAFMGWGSWQGVGLTSGDNSTIVNSSGEVSIQVMLRSPGVMSKMAIYASAGSQVIGLRQNAANGNESAGGSTGFQQDASDTDTLSSGDMVDWSISNASGEVEFAYGEFSGSGATFDWFSAMDQEGVWNTSNTYFAAIGGEVVVDSFHLTEAPWQQRVPFGITFSNMRYRSFSSSPSTFVTANFRVNGASGNQAVAISNPDGIYEDASDTDVTATNDLVAIMFNQNTTGHNMQISQGMITMLPAGGGGGGETSTGALAWDGLAFDASAAIPLSSGGALHFGALAMGGRAGPPETSAGVLHFAGVSFLAFSGKETLAGAMRFGRLAMAGAVLVPAIAGGAMHFGGIAFDAGGGARVAELDIGAVLVPAVDAQVAELDVGALLKPAIVAQVTELDVAVVASPIATTGANVTELDVAVLAYPGPCATSRCQVWKITRKDGTVFAFTSLDTPVEYLGVTYSPCKSLSSTAAESSSELKSVGNVELTGILDDSTITGEDLYSGLFDDAFVEVWVIPYDGQPDDQAPFRQAAGWLGKVTRGEYNFTADVIGPGARLGQAAVVDFVTPGCRWDFGVLDANGIGCPVDPSAYQIVNVPVTGSTLRSLIDFTAMEPPPVGGIQPLWNDGTITWQTGRNAGVVCQVETVDFGAQALSLWDLAPYPPAIGDLFTLKPGCPKTKTGCLNYEVYESFGGFPDVPGPDALQSNADSLFT